MMGARSGTLSAAWEDRIQLETDRYVAQRALPGLVMPTAVMVAFLAETGPSSPFWKPGLVSGGISLLMTVPRIWLTRKVKRIPEGPAERRWRRMFAVATVASCAVYSVFLAIGIRQLDDVVMAAVMTFAASTYVAGATHVYAARKRLMQAVTAALMLLPLLATLLREPGYRGTLALMLLLPTAYYLVLGRRVHDEYWQLAQARAQIDQRNRDLRLLLDNVDQAFLTIDSEGYLAPERSAMVDRWFGAYTGRTLLTDHIARTDALFSEELALGLEALREDFLPREISLAQLPTRIRHGDRQYRCTYVPLPSDDAAQAGLLVVIDDVTDVAQRTEEEVQQRELLAVAQGVMSDRAGYVAFFEEARDLVAQLEDRAIDAVTCARVLHTLKGNAATVGAEALVAQCHAAEEELEQGELTAAGLDRLRARWNALKSAASKLMGTTPEGVVELAPASIDALVRAVVTGVPRAAIAASLGRLKLEPVERPLQRLASYAVPLAQRLGKGDLATQVSAPDLRLDPKIWNRLWSVLVHVVRNAVDHGLESPEARVASGKSVTPTLALSARADDDTLVIEIHDDGRGIDWARVRARAAEQGRTIAGADDLVRLLLDPGFTTRDNVTTTSGRGMGMAAVAEEVRRLGGRIEVESSVGMGTCWRVTLPMTGPSAEHAFSCPPVSAVSLH